MAHLDYFSLQSDIDELEKALTIIHGVTSFYRDQDGIAKLAGLIGEQIALRKYEIEQNKKHMSTLEQVPKG